MGSREIIRWLPLAACVFAASGCSALNSSPSRGSTSGLRFGGPPERHSRPAISSFSKNAVLLELPFEGQTTPNLCGLAALEMLTRYYGVLLTVAQRQVFMNEAERADGITGQP